MEISWRGPIIWGQRLPDPQGSPNHMSLGKYAWLEVLLHRSTDIQSAPVDIRSQLS